MLLRRRCVYWHRYSSVTDSVCKGTLKMVEKYCQCGGSAVQVQLPPGRWEAAVLCSWSTQLEKTLDNLLSEERWAEPQWGAGLGGSLLNKSNLILLHCLNAEMSGLWAGMMPPSFLWTHPLGACGTFFSVERKEGLEGLGSCIYF